jgi:hypothetical protein
VTGKQIALLVALAAIFFSLVLAYLGRRSPIPSEPTAEWPLIKKIQLVVLVAWVLVPPLWFSFEYTFCFLPGRLYCAGVDFEKYKYDQDLTSKAWVAVSSTLLLLYFGKDIQKK